MDEMKDLIWFAWLILTAILIVCLQVFAAYFVYPKTNVYAEQIRLEAEYERLKYDGMNVKIKGEK